MKIDKFTKIVLTVIAVNLTILTIKQLDIIPKAYAYDNHPSIENPYMNYGLVPLNEDGSIDVNVNSFSPNSVMDVNIDGISTWDKLYVHISSSESYSLQNAGPLVVEVE